MIEFEIAQALYFFLPAYAANMAPVFVKKLDMFDWPVDAGTGILGSHKTWRGIFFGIGAAILVAYIQSRYAASFPNLSIANYEEWIGLGFLLGLGALAGDSVKSYFKRKKRIKPGGRWIPWDQIDYVIGGLALSYFVFFPGLRIAVILLFASFILHYIVSWIGYDFGLRRHPW